MVHDHLAPLQRLPKLNSPAKLGFGPPSLRLSTSPGLIVGEGRAWFRLRLEGQQPAGLGWHTTTTFARVNWKGQVIEKLGVTKKRIVGLANSGVGFALGADDEPGAYRMTTVVTNPHGHKLGGFGTYARLVQPTKHGRLALTPGPYRPGTAVFARIENLGTASISFGAPWRIERFNGSSWELAPESRRGPWILPLYFALPGLSSHDCVANVTPAATGLYRVVKEVEYFWPGGPGPADEESIELTAEFEVL